MRVDHVGGMSRVDVQAFQSLELEDWYSQGIPREAQEG